MFFRKSSLWATVALLVGVLMVAACAAPTQTPGSTATSTSVSTSVPPPTGAPTATVSNVGTLQVRATDAPAAKEVTKILLTLTSVEVHRQVGETEAGWVTVVTDPPPFDLKAITGVEQILGTAQLEAGQYQQVRLKVKEAKVTVDGKEELAKVPSDVLRIVGGFTVIAGETTVLTLDFDAERSVVIAGPNVNLKPVVKLLVRKGGEPTSAGKEIGKTPVEPGPEPTQAPVPPATSTPPPTAAPNATATVVPSPTSTVAPTATATRTPTATVVPPATATPQSGTVSASIVDFANENLTIRVGTTVVWTNTGGAPHTATSGMFPTASGVWNSGNLNSGQSFSFSFTQAGSFPYYCSYHGMTATVTVVP